MTRKFGKYRYSFDFKFVIYYFWCFAVIVDRYRIEATTAQPYTLHRQIVAVISNINLNMQGIFIARIKTGPRRRGGCDCIATLTFVKNKANKISNMFWQIKNSPAYIFNNLSDFVLADQK